jgi:hypothetical protein
MSDKRFDARPKTKSRVRRHTRRTEAGQSVVREHVRNLTRKGWDFTVTAKKQVRYKVNFADRVDQVAYQTEFTNQGKVPMKYLENIDYSVKHITDDVHMVTIGYDLSASGYPSQDHPELGFALGMLDIQVNSVFGDNNVILDDFYFSLHRANLTYVVKKPGVTKKEWEKYHSYKQPEYRMANKPYSLDIFKVRRVAEKTYGGTWRG